MKDILHEGAKVKKQFHQLELYLSHWLNLIYLESMIKCVDQTDSFSFTVFSKEVNQNILFKAAERVRKAFEGIPTHSEFLKDILKHVENSIPNITFDIKSVELARAYRHKAKELKAQQSRKKSSDLSTTLSSHQIQSKPSSLGILSPGINDSGHREKMNPDGSDVKENHGVREPFRQISSPFSKRIDDAINREAKYKETFKRRAAHYKGEEIENNENLPKTLKINGPGLLKGKRAAF